MLFENGIYKNVVLVVEGSNPSVPTKPSKGFVKLSKPRKKYLVPVLVPILEFILFLGSLTSNNRAP
jgi:hypothetical protein